jgi:hypothetical protein
MPGRYVAGGPRALTWAWGLTFQRWPHLARTSLFKSSDVVVQMLSSRDVWMRSITGRCWIN